MGPEILRFDDVVRRIAAAVGSRAWIVKLPSRIVLALGWVLARVLRDVLLTRDEVAGLRSELLVSSQAPNGTTGFSRWLEDHGPALGRRYASELARHYR